MMLTMCSIVSCLGLVSSEDCKDQCPSGRWGSAIGLTAASECQPCKRGRYSIGIGLNEECQSECPTGRYGASTGLIRADEAP
jgi:hypothetical protein